jgi:surface polysaccharide O-acyltransferase-like enzyme
VRLYHAGRVTSGSRQRFSEVDWIKAVGILVVVGIHSLRPVWNPDASPQERWLLHASVFAVPGFVLASGVLHAAREPIPWPVTRRRIARLLVPYLVASAGAEVVGTIQRAGLPTPGRLALDLLLGEAFGIYYYVPLMLLFVALAPLLARLPFRACIVLLGVALATELVYAGPLAESAPVRWLVRNPLRWWGYYLLGWVLGLLHARASAWIAERRLALGAAAGLGFASAAWALARPPAPESLHLVVWLGAHAALALLVVLSIGRASVPAPVRALSERTYPIYLFHYFFVLPVLAALPAPAKTFAPGRAAAAWVAGLAGALAVTALGRAVLGPRSRLWLGA